MPRKGLLFLHLTAVSLQHYVNNTSEEDFEYPTLRRCRQSKLLPLRIELSLLVESCRLFVHGCNCFRHPINSVFA